MSTHTVAIIGAGPIGIELAVALKQAGVDTIHLEANQIAHTISWFPHQAYFFSSPDRIAIAGVPLQTDNQTKATREQYLAYLRGIVQQFNLDIHTYEKVTAIDKQNDIFTLTTTHHDQSFQYHARNVVLAVGDMARPRLLDIPGEDLPHVSHYFDEPHRYFRQNLLIAGGRNSAVEAAIRCHRAGAKVSISYRRDDFDKQSVKYWLYPEIKSLIKSGEISFHPHTVPTTIAPDHVTLQNTCSSSNDDTIDVPADFVLLMTGYVADQSLLQLAGVQLEGENLAPKIDPHAMQTNIENLYVAGTAAAGTQNRFRLFIENCHIHVARIVADITGCCADDIMDKIYILPES